MSRWSHVVTTSVNYERTFAGRRNLQADLHNCLRRHHVKVNRTAFSELKPGMLLTSNHGYQEKAFVEAVVLCVHEECVYVQRQDGAHGSMCHEHRNTPSWFVARDVYGSGLVSLHEERPKVAPPQMIPFRHVPRGARIQLQCGKTSDGKCTWIVSDLPPHSSGRPHVRFESRGCSGARCNDTWNGMQSTQLVEVIDHPSIVVTPCGLEECPCHQPLFASCKSTHPGTGILCANDDALHVGRHYTPAGMTWDNDRDRPAGTKRTSFGDVGYDLPVVGERARGFVVPDQSAMVVRSDLSCPRGQSGGLDSRIRESRESRGFSSRNIFRRDVGGPKTIRVTCRRLTEA